MGIRKTIRESITNLIIESVPERNEEIQRLWKDYSPQFNMANDKVGFFMKGGAYDLVLFTHRTMLQIWLLGFASWKAFQAYGTPLEFFRVRNEDLNQSLLDNIEDQEKVEKEYYDIISTIENLKSINNIENFKWPKSIPKAEEVNPQNTVHKAVHDIICMCGAYLFLHEVKHIQFANSEKIVSPHVEEFECDKFAREFLLDKVDKYSAESGYDKLGVLSKRATSISLASHLLLVITPPENWDGTKSHPSVKERISRLVTSVELPPNDYFWIFLVSILIAQLNANDLSIPKTSFDTQKELCQKLLNLNT